MSWDPVDLFAVVVVLFFPAIAGVVSLLSAITAGRCFRRLSYATTNDLGTAVVRKIIQVNMTHRALPLIDVECRSRYIMGLIP